jgi:RHH-type transcriptional regulator, rel operon repressor / antitoxin RelB
MTVANKELTLSVAPPVHRRIEELAAARHVSAEDILREAITAYLDYDAWATAEIEAGVREADAGDFASEEEVEDAFRRLRS